MDKYTYLSKKDYRVDFLKWIKKCDNDWGIPSGNSSAKISCDSLKLDKIQQEIIKDNNSAFACFFAINFKYKPHLMQQIILNNNDAKYAFLFAQNINNCDVQALQRVVVKSKKIKYIGNFACFVKNADRKVLEKLIIESKNVKYAHMFLKHVNGADINKFKNIILSSKKPSYLFELAKEITDPDEILKIEDAILASKSFRYMRLFAAKIAMANVERIEQVVLDTDNINEIKKFAKYVKRSKMKRFFLVL